MQRLFWTFFNLGELTICFLMAYFTRFIMIENTKKSIIFIRNIYKEYSLCKETTIITIINFCYFNFINLLPHFLSFQSVCIGPLPFGLVFKDLRHLIIAMIVTIYPLSICGKAHFPLPPSLMLDDLKFFLLEEKCFKTFYKYLSFLEVNTIEGKKKEITYGLK